MTSCHPAFPGILSELLEVSFHQILFTRGLYPEKAFTKKKKYNLPTQICMHPDVQKYIENIVRSLKDVLNSNELTSVQFIVFNTETNEIKEKFIFQISQLKKNQSEQLNSDWKLTELEESFRSLLLKLSVSDSILKKYNASDCSYRVVAQVPSISGELLRNSQFEETPFFWIEAEPHEEVLADPKIVPIKSVFNDVCSLQLFVQEPTEKS